MLILMITIARREYVAVLLDVLLDSLYPNAHSQVPQNYSEI